MLNRVSEQTRNQYFSFLNTELTIYVLAPITWLGIFLMKHCEDMGDTIIKLVDKLAGKESDIKLSFQDLTLDLGVVKAKLNGSIVLDLVYPADAQKK
jgi:hypothetical protein